MQAEQKKNVLLTQVEGEKRIAENKTRAEVVEIVNKAQAAANTKKKQTDENANVTIINAESTLQATRAQYDALLEEGRAEQKNLESFEVKRRHDYEVHKAMAYEKFSEKSKHVVISGQSGNQLLSTLLDFADEKKK